MASTSSENGEVMSSYRSPQWLRLQTNSEICKEEPSDENLIIRTTEELGRHLVAGKTFKPGAILIKEKPLLIGPCGYAVQCLGCYQVFKRVTDFVKCNGCGWPICKLDCKGLGKPFGHLKNECDVLKQVNSSELLNYENFNDMLPLYILIMPLRCLLLKVTNKEAFGKLMTLESKIDFRRAKPIVWERTQHNIVDKIKKIWKLVDYDENEVHKICGILQVNKFVTGPTERKIFAIYHRASLMSHNCIPNTYYTDDPDNDYTFTVRASTEILADQPLRVIKCYSFFGTIKRRETLAATRYIQCKCSRCSDPTESGTYMSALRCPKCKKGWILSEDPLVRESDWKCINRYSDDPTVKCPGYTATAEFMDSVIEEITHHFNSIKWGDCFAYEKFLARYKNVLHPSHYLCLRTKLILSRAYGRGLYFSKDNMTIRALRRKVQICQELLEILDIVEPGFNAVRAVTLHELHDARMTVMLREYTDETISDGEFQLQQLEINSYVEETHLIMQYESGKTYDRLLKS